MLRSTGENSKTWSSPHIYVVLIDDLFCQSSSASSSHGVFSVLTDSDAIRKFVLFRIDFDKITKLLQEFENFSTKLQVTRREGILEENIALVIRGCPPKSTVTGCTSPRHITRPSFVTTPRCTTSRRPHFQFAWLFIRPSR